MMNEFLTLLFPLVAGALLGVVFFGGLWLTVRNGFSFKNPALLFFGSLLLRSGIVVTGFYFVTGGQFNKLIACLIGFITARIVMTRIYNPRINNQHH
jgi:F1F0 ATPase subunit 2